MGVNDVRNPIMGSALLVAAALLAGGPPAAAQAPISLNTDPTLRIIERILVKVNGEIITQSDLEERQVAAIRARGVQPATNAELMQLVREVTPEVLTAAVEELLLVERGRELGYQLSYDQFRDYLDSLREENGIESDEQFIEMLEQQEGMTLDDFRRLVERQMLAGQVQQVQVLGRVTITDVEAREYYDSHIEEFTDPATVTLREIIVAAPEDPTANLLAERSAREAAEAVRQRVLDGEAFEAVAAATSTAPSKDNGGLIGPFQVNEVAESIRELIVGLEPGGVSEVRRTTQGYQILQLAELVDDFVRPFDAVRDEISQRAFGERREAAYREFLDELYADAIIDWKSEELQEAFDQFRSRQRLASAAPQD